MKHFKAIFLVLGLCSVFSVQAQDIVEDKIKPAYFCELNTGFLAGETVSGWMHVKNGFTLGKFWNVSFVTGIEGHRPGIFIPLGFEGRFAFNHKKTSPFVSMSSTYLQNTGTRNYGYYYTQVDRTLGFSGGAKLGVQHFFSKSVGIVTSVGYRYTFMEQNGMGNICWECLPYETDLLHHMNRFELTFGFIFR